MAGENDTKQPEKGSGSGGGGGGGGSSNQPRKPSGRKGMFDLTNLLGSLSWLASALLTCIAIMVAFLNIPSACLGERGQLAGCVPQIVTSTEGSTVIIGGILVQLLFSAVLFRLRHNTVIHRIGSIIEWVVNGVGIYWLFCVQLGVAPGIYETVSTFTRTIGQRGTFLWWVAFIGLAVGWDLLTDALFKAPAVSGGSPQSTRR